MAAVLPAVVALYGSNDAGYDPNYVAAVTYQNALEVFGLAVATVHTPLLLL